MHSWPASCLWFCLMLGLLQLQGYHKIFVLSCSPSEKPRFYMQPVCSISPNEQYYSHENPLVWEVRKERSHKLHLGLYLFIYLGFYVAFNTVQVISRQVVGRAEETSTYSSLGFCTVNCRPMASNYQLSQLRPYRELNPGLRGGRLECYHSATIPRPVREASR